MWTILTHLREWRARAKARTEEFERRSEEIERRFQELEKQWEQEIAPLPLTEAKLRADRLLSDPSRFTWRQARLTEEDRAQLDHLAPYLKEFFERYAEVTLSPYTGDVVARDLLASVPVVEALG